MIYLEGVKEIQQALNRLVITNDTNDNVQFCCIVRASPVNGSFETQAKFQECITGVKLNWNFW